jgi:hypothetical protein
MDDNANRMSDEELDRWVADLLAGGSDDEENWRDHLQKSLDANRELRDDNFVHPESVLVFSEAARRLEETPLWELPLKYPLKGHGQRWSTSDLGEILEAKATLYRQSKAANDLAEEHPDATPECGTVVLVDPDRPGPLHWCVIKARIAPELNR